MPSVGVPKPLNLRAGELVQVRSEAEILATLDSNGRLGAMPFMPEMLQYCGKQFRVFKRAHKSCDTISKTGGRKMESMVHLTDLYCDGAAHGGCQAGCLIYWKEEWLVRVNPRPFPGFFSSIKNIFHSDSSRQSSANPALSKEAFLLTTQIQPAGAVPEDTTYTCQVTEILNASKPLPWWDFRQYFEDLSSGNVSLREVASVLLYYLVKHTLEIKIGYRAQLWFHNRVQKLLGFTPFPFRAGTQTKTPTEDLNLQPGELVQVKSNQEILDTLDARSKNKGLLFDLEEVPYCGGQYKVRNRVDRIINEKNGKMMQLPGASVILDGVVCKALYSDCRIFCPRSVFCYWREIWLKRVG